VTTAGPVSTAQGSGPAVVLLHGLASSSLLWGSTVAALRERHRVVTIDLPGFGESAPPGDGFEIAAISDAIAAVAARAIKPKRRYALVGHSLGGAVATLVAARDPSRVSKLVLAAPAGYQRLPVSAIRAVAGVNERLVDLRRRVGRDFVRRPRARALMFTPSIHDAGALSPADALLLLDASAGSRRVAAALTSVAALDLRPALAQVKAPVGVIWGRHDRMVPPAGLRRIRRAQPDVVVEWIEDAGHVPMLERPAEWEAALQRLLR
jgi:pimeloyl-ACP methyl ester carboxylesterase